MSNRCPQCGARYNPDDAFVWDHLDFDDAAPLFGGDVLELPCGHSIPLVDPDPVPMTAAQIDCQRRTRLFQGVAFPWE